MSSSRVRRNNRRSLGACREVTTLASRVEGPGLVVGVEHLLLANVVCDRRARDSLGHDLPAPVLALEHVVLGVLVAEPLHHLRVGRERVPALDEGLAGDLPVGVDHTAEMRVDDAIGVVPAIPVVEHRAEETLEGLGVRIHVDEHEAVPLCDLGLGKREVLRIYLREVPGARDELGGAVDVPAEPVERAAQLTHPSVLGPKCASTVQAHVVQGLDLAGLRTHDDEFVVGDVVVDVIPRLGDLVGAAHHLPDLAPHLLNLAVVPLARNEALDIEGLGAKVLVHVVSQHGWYWPSIVIEIFLHTRARGSRAIRLRRCALWRNAQVSHETLLDRAGALSDLGFNLLRY